MRTITIIGWSAKVSAVVERETFWPDEMKLHVAIAKASNITDLMTIEDVLVEKREPPLHKCEVCGGVLNSAYVCHHCKK